MRQILVSLIYLSSSLVFATPDSSRVSISLPGIWTSSQVSIDAAAKSSDAIMIAPDLKFYNGKYDFKSRKFIPTAARHSNPGRANKLEIEGSEIVFYLDGAEERAGFVKIAPGKFKTVTTDDPPIIIYYFKQK
ncbi:MAG: hypothetical protein JNM27_13520 [Leptospirales bacterium]|nr:hypothetical protein [Leptospirales bacterium]